MYSVEHYKMLPMSNRPGQFYKTAKMRKFYNVANITFDNLNFRPITTQSATYTYNAAQVIASYIKPSCSNNEQIIWNTQKFSKAICNGDPWKSNNENFWMFKTDIQTFVA